RGKEFDLASLQAEVGRRFVSEIIIAAGNNFLVQCAKKAFKFLLGCRKVPVDHRPSSCPLRTPLQRTHHAVRVPGCKPGLPRVHPFGIEIWHWFESIGTVTRSQRADIERSTFSTQQSAISIQSANVLG